MSDATAVGKTPKPRKRVNEWAEGIAPVLKPSTKEETETVVSLSDIHVPFHNTALVESAVRLIHELQPNVVVLNGDISDFFQLSRFNTGLERLDTLQDEIDVTNMIRRMVRSAAPNAVIRENEGNHDSRIISYVETHARALKSLRAITPAQLFQWDTLEFEAYSGAGFRIRPNFVFKHGTIIRQEVPSSAKGELLAANANGVSGHTHRLGTYRRVGYTTRQWTEQGCLCHLNPDYVIGPPNWTNGIVVAQFSTKSDAFVVEEVSAIGEKFVYGGREF